MRKLARLLDEALERRFARDFAVVPGGRRVGRKEIDQRLVALEVGEIEHGRDKGDAVELNARIEQRIGQTGSARGPVALTNDELRTVPALIFGQVALDRARE